MSLITIGIVNGIAFFKDFPYLGGKQKGYHYKQHMAVPAMVAAALIIPIPRLLLHSSKHCSIGRLNVAALSSSPTGRTAGALQTKYFISSPARNLPVISDGHHVDKILKMTQLQFPYYNVFIIHGRSKEREITAPSLKLKIRQRWILDEILKKSECCHGFVTGKSIVTNAEKHIGKNKF